MLATKVAVVGGGPVGLLASLLLQHFDIDFICFEKSEKLRSHPSAHWVSARSKQILSQIPSLTESIDKQQETFQHFRSYRYCEAVGGREFGKTDHFLPSVEERLRQSFNHFGQFPSHISQSKLLSLEFECLRQKERVLLGQQVGDLAKTDEGYLIKNSKNEVIGKSKYVILSNGFNSSLRDSLGISMGQGREFYRLVNIHFTSCRLAGLIGEQGCEAMLHFVYNRKTPCVLVNHSLTEGEFVLQVPNYEPFVDLLQVYSPIQLIESAIAPSFFAKMGDLEVKHVGRWKLQAQIASQMHLGNIFLAGDAAHTYTPAGGFGMNCGFQDANQLVHTLRTLERNPRADVEKLREMYSADRLNANRMYLEKSLRNYELTDQVASQLGFPSQLTDYFFAFCRFLPQINAGGMGWAEKARLLAMRGLFRPGQVQPQLGLFFDEFDSGVQRMSGLLPRIVDEVRRKRGGDVWVDGSVERREVEELFGELSEERVVRGGMPAGERIVRSDGVVMK